MSNIHITVTKNDKQDQYDTNGYLLVYMAGEEFKFAGTLELKALAPLLLKLAMEKMSK